MFEIRRGDSSYPECLRSIESPPSILWGIGETGILGSGSRVAIVGSRQATEYGRGVAYDLAKSLAGRGITVISGLAYGIDTAAHEGALAGGGKTIAVLGCGIECPYPKENLRLRHEISRSGAVISEFPGETEPTSWNFPRRNRIISGLSQAVVIVEAAEKSGALITAQWALAQGREVFAVPGNITSERSAGTNRLIQSGAHPLLSIEDLLTTLKLPWKEKQPVIRPPEEEAILTSLDRGIRSMDQVADSTGINASEIAACLVSLEIRGEIRALPGGLYERVHG